MIQKIVKAIVKLLPHVDMTLFMIRLKTCATCSSRVVDKEVGWTCGKYLAPNEENKTCGCMVREKAKLIWFDCPQNKWPKIKECKLIHNWFIDNFETKVRICRKCLKKQAFVSGRWKRISDEQFEKLKSKYSTYSKP